MERFGIYGSLLDELESSGEEMAEMEKVAIMTDIFGASQDTTAALIKWMMLYLVKHDHYQKPVCFIFVCQHLGAFMPSCQSNN